MSDLKIIDAKFIVPRMVSQDTTEPELAQTPRSGSQTPNSDGYTDYGQSPKNSSRSGSLSGSKSSVSDGDADNGEDAYQQEDYYAFLREMAGSFEAGCEDDESEVSSDSEGSSDEDEGGEPIGRKRSSADDQLLENCLPASPPSEGRGRSQGLGSPEAQEEFAKVSGSLVAKGAPSQPTRVGCPAKMVMQYGGPPSTMAKQGRPVPSPLVAAATQVAAMRPVPSPLVAAATQVAASQGEDASDAIRERPRQLATPSSDTRPPVVDDYDVAKATAEYAEQRLPLSRFERQCEDLQVAIRLRQDQAERLLEMSRKKLLDPELRAHYARVRLELFAEAKTFEEQLAALSEAHQATSTQACSYAATISHQETDFGCSSGVVVQC